MLINFLDIPGLWNLTWIVPLAVVTGIGLYALFGGSKSRNPEGPPYADFDTRLDAHIEQRGIRSIDPGAEATGKVWFDPIMGEFVRTPEAGQYPLPEVRRRQGPPPGAHLGPCEPGCFEPGAHAFRYNTPGDFIS